MLGLRPLGEWPACDAIDLILVHACAAYGDGAVDRITKHIRQPFWLTEADWGMTPDDEANLAEMERRYAPAGPAMVRPPRTAPTGVD